MARRSLLGSGSSSDRHPSVLTHSRVAMVRAYGVALREPYRWNDTSYGVSLAHRWAAAPPPSTSAGARGFVARSAGGGTTDSRRSAGLPSEPLLPRPERSGGKTFDRRGAAERPLVRAMDDAHPAAAELPLERGATGDGGLEGEEARSQAGWGAHGPVAWARAASQPTPLPRRPPAITSVGKCAPAEIRSALTPTAPAYNRTALRARWRNCSRSAITR